MIVAFTSAQLGGTVIDSDAKVRSQAPQDDVALFWKRRNVSATRAAPYGGGGGGVAATGGNGYPGVGGCGGSGCGAAGAAGTFAAFATSPLTDTSGASADRQTRAQSVGGALSL